MPRVKVIRSRSSKLTLDCLKTSDVKRLLLKPWSRDKTISRSKDKEFEAAPAF